MSAPVLIYDGDCPSCSAAVVTLWRIETLTDWFDEHALEGDEDGEADGCDRADGTTT